MSGLRAADSALESLGCQHKALIRVSLRCHVTGCRSHSALVQLPPAAAAVMLQVRAHPWVPSSIRRSWLLWLCCAAGMRTPRATHWTRTPTLEPLWGASPTGAGLLQPGSWPGAAAALATAQQAAVSAALYCSDCSCTANCWWHCMASPMHLITGIA